MALMGSLLSKYVIFGQNVQNWDILWAKMTPYVEIWEKWSNNLFNISKNYFSPFFGHKFGKKCH